MLTKVCSKQPWLWYLPLDSTYLGMHTTWDVPPSLWATVEFIPEEFTDIYLALVQKLKFSTRGFSCTTLSLIKTTVYCIKLNITQLSFPEKISDYKILVSKHKFLLSSIKKEIP